MLVIALALSYNKRKIDRLTSSEKDILDVKIVLARCLGKVKGCGDRLGIFHSVHLNAVAVAYNARLCDLRLLLPF